MKQLIVDYLPFQITPEQINESIKENNGKLIVKVFYKDLPFEVRQKSKW